MNIPEQADKRGNHHRLKLIWCALSLWLAFGTSTTAQAADVLLTVPFENTSGKPEYHWIGESFSVMVDDLLDTPAIKVLSREERHLAYERLGLSATGLLTRAAMMKVADTAQANLVLVGDYDIGGEPNAATIAVRARLIEARSGRLVGNKVFNFSGPLADLQTMQGQLAWNVLYERDPASNYTRDKLVSRARGIPQRAFESYVKGILTSDPKLREAFLRRAIQEYDSESSAGHYALALYELGLFYYAQRNFAEAARHLRQLEANDPNYLVAQYHFGLAAYNSGSLSEAASAYEKLVAPLPLTEVYNNAGALLTAKDDFLGALTVLQRGVEVSPSDLMMRFNYGYALWKNKEYDKAVLHLKVVVAANTRDAEALYVLAKCLAGAGKKIEADQYDQEARRYLGNYAKWEVQQDKIPLLIRLNYDFNRAAFYKLGRVAQPVSPAPRGQEISLQKVMEDAQRLFLAGSDAECLMKLQEALTADPTFAEAHMLRGKIFQRRNEIEQAISALKAAVYWNPRLTGAHISLGQIFLARGDRASALTHSKRAIELDPQDREAVALLRQIEGDR